MTACVFWNIEQEFSDLAQARPKFGDDLAQTAYAGSQIHEGKEEPTTDSRLLRKSRLCSLPPAARVDGALRFCTG